jgi:hypothetical protein
MNTILDLEKLSHRSKSRIKDLGEVFTPESYVEDMLDLLAKNKKGIWSDEEITFFEPCAGHGNIVLSIYKRRLEALYKKALGKGNRDAAYYAVANALNTIWAIDIDAKNIENCRSRVFLTTLDFLKTKLNVTNVALLFSKKKDFFAHILAAIKWHLEVNETLSALSNPESARTNANLTKLGGKWFTHNGHHQLDFNITWVKFFKECEGTNTIPIEFERAMRFVESTISGRMSKGFDDYEFAKLVINPGRLQARTPARDSISVGA